jgi:bifunctional non-homologous end joining protein LigD
VELRYRSGGNATATFPDVVRALTALPYGSLVLDGEVVVLDDQAHPSFSLLQRRAQLSRRIDIERSAVELPAIYFVFDLLALGDHDLRGLPLVERKRLLREVLPATGPLRYVDDIPDRGEDFYQQIRAMGLEGMVGKQSEAPYRGGRSTKWIKVRAERTGDFAVIGYTMPRHGGSGLGALHLAAVSGDRLVYAGRVGTGFKSAELKAFRAQLDADSRTEPAAEGELPGGDKHRWADPRLVVEVAFTEVTPGGQLRHPVYRRLRDDKEVRDCVRDDLPTTEPEVVAMPQTLPAPQVVEVTRPTKIFWPDEGYTKGDLFEYYRAIGPWLLPFLRDRPLVLDRYPDGINGKSFYQKNAPEFAPDWIRTENVHSDDSKETEYFVCDTLEALLYVVNLGAIPLHIWPSRIGSLQHPDWCLLDLDPKQAPFESVVRVAREIHSICKLIGLPAHPKTSGGTGMHVLVPLGGQLTYEQSRQLAEVMARILVQRLPEIATVNRALDARDDKVYIDWVQNGYGKLMVAPFSARPAPGAKVSTPLSWAEVNARLDPAKHHIQSVPARVKRRKTRLLEPVLDTRPDLSAALGRLYQEFD